MKKLLVLLGMFLLTSCFREDTVVYEKENEIQEVTVIVDGIACFLPYIDVTSGGENYTLHVGRLYKDWSDSTITIITVESKYIPLSEGRNKDRIPNRYNRVLKK